MLLSNIHKVASFVEWTKLPKTSAINFADDFSDGLLILEETRGHLSSSFSMNGMTYSRWVWSLHLITTLILWMSVSILIMHFSDIRSIRIKNLKNKQLTRWTTYQDLRHEKPFVEIWHRLCTEKWDLHHLSVNCHRKSLFERQPQQTKIWYRWPLEKLFFEETKLLVKMVEKTIPTTNRIHLNLWQCWHVLHTVPITSQI